MIFFSLYFLLYHLSLNIGIYFKKSGILIFLLYNKLLEKIKLDKMINFYYKKINTLIKSFVFNKISILYLFK